jgi:hypothetical protein
MRECPREVAGGSILNRRAMLMTLGAGLAARLRGASDDFWNTKAAGLWSGEEVTRLITDSPWAQQVSVEFAGGSSGEMSGPMAPIGGVTAPVSTEGQPRGGARTGDGGALGIPRGGARVGAPAPPERRIGPETLRAQVVWESAQAVLDGLKQPLPEGFENLYVIGVSGDFLSRVRLSGASGSQQDGLAGLRQSATLEVKDKPQIHADMVQAPGAAGRVFRFGFSRAALAIAPGDSEVLFQAKIAGVRVQARFNLASMTYRGKLAV